MLSALVLIVVFCLSIGGLCLLTLVSPTETVPVEKPVAWEVWQKLPRRR